MTEDKLYSSAKHLLFDPNDREAIFTQRASKMLTQIFLAARIENKAAGKEQYRLLPYVRQMVDLGLKGAAARLDNLPRACHTVSRWGIRPPERLHRE